MMACADGTSHNTGNTKPKMTHGTSTTMFNTAEKSCPPGTINSRRHRDNGQIIAQLSNFTHHCHDEVSVEVTFVDLIEDDGIHPSQVGVAE